MILSNSNLSNYMGCKPLLKNASIVKWYQNFRLLTCKRTRLGAFLRGADEGLTRFYGSREPLRSGDALPRDSRSRETSIHSSAIFIIVGNNMLAFLFSLCYNKENLRHFIYEKYLRI